MNRSNRQRIERLEDRMLARDCRTCWNTGSILIHVPAGEDKDLPEFNPTHCEECARPLRMVRKVMGLSREAIDRLHQRRERVA